MKTASNSTLFAKVGDRWLLPLPTSPLVRIQLEGMWNLLLEEGEELFFQSSTGKRIPLDFSMEENALRLREMVEEPIPSKAHGAYLQLVRLEPTTFALSFEMVDSFSPPPPLKEENVEIIFHDDHARLHRPSVSWELFQLSQTASQFASAPDFETLISLPLLREIDLYDHQIKTVTTALRRFRGRALLCDEVGLGKTVEAGLILLELFARKLVRRTLILTPPSLVAQWQGEMMRKFSMKFITYDDLSFKEQKERAWRDNDAIIASYHTAKREPHRSLIAQETWDMVIIDEAHHFRNNATLLWKFASELRKKYILLLTATPMQNSLSDLHNLVTLLKPGLLATSKQFKERFVDRKKNSAVKNVEELRELISECMIRNRRASISVNFTKRFAKTFRLPSTKLESDLYEEATAFIKGELKQKNPLFPRLSLLSLQKLMGSSPKAALHLLENILTTNRLPEEATAFLRSLVDRLQLIHEPMKSLRLLSLLQEFPEKLIIFTQFRATQEHLSSFLKERGYGVTLFHGGLTRMQKEEAIDHFREEGRILISTDSGSEGRNLQFCHAICNYDLPWNPMRIEQRIGRISRLGQTEDVYIFNMVHEKTIEDRVLYILEAKINLFEQVIGEMDMILGNLDESCEFEDLILNLWLESKDESHFSSEMEKLGEQLIKAKENYLEQQREEEALFGNRLEAKE